MKIGGVVIASSQKSFASPGWTVGTGLFSFRPRQCVGQFEGIEIWREEFVEIFLEFVA
jgi:hypothetical protein